MNNQTPLRVPPHSHESEQCVIGSILMARDSWDIVLDSRIKPDDFYNRSHQLIFKAVIRLLNKNSPVDLITLSEELESTGELDMAGGFAYLGELAKNTPSAANVAHYCEIVRERSSKRKLIGAACDIQEMCYANDGAEIKEIIASAEDKVMTVGDDATNDDKDLSIKEVLRRYVDYTQMLLNRDSDLAGISTGLSALDDITSGFVNGDLVVLAARPSMGKTTLLMNFIRQEIYNGGYPLLFSLEMPEQQIINKFISSMGKIDFGKIKNPKLMSDEEWTRYTSAMAKLSESNLMIDDGSGLSNSDLKIRCNKYKKIYGRYPSIVGVDYLQLMKASSKENRTLQIKEISNGLKELAKYLNCPVVALSQLNRSLENRADKRPVNSDLRESGDIEQDADLIMFIYRDEVYNDNSPNRGLAEILVRKQRNGPIGMAGATFNGVFSRFDDMGNRQIVDEQPDKPGYFT